MILEKLKELGIMPVLEGCEGMYISYLKMVYEKNDTATVIPNSFSGGSVFDEVKFGEVKLVADNIFPTFCTENIFIQKKTWCQKRLFMITLFAAW